MSPEAFRLSAALVGIILLVLLVARLKWHPFLALMLVSWGLAVTCGIDPVQAILAFSKGFGDILSFVGIVIGLGTMILDYDGDVAGDPWFGRRSFGELGCLVLNREPSTPP